MAVNLEGVPGGYFYLTGGVKPLVTAAPGASLCPMSKYYTLLAPERTCFQRIIALREVLVCGKTVKIQLKMSPKANHPLLRSPEKSAGFQQVSCPWTHNR